METTSLASVGMPMKRRDQSFSSSQALADMITEDTLAPSGDNPPLQHRQRANSNNSVDESSANSSYAVLDTVQEEPSEAGQKLSPRLDSHGVIEKWQFNHVHAVAEINFLANIGDLKRLQTAVKKLRIELKRCYDYDQRTPLHVACDAGSYAVAEWLIEAGSQVNSRDRFGNTPLSCAVKSGHKLLTQLLDSKGGLVPEAPGRASKLVCLGESSLHGSIDLENYDDDLDERWEIPADSIEVGKLLGEGQFGSVYQAQWRGTPVAVKKIKLDMEEDVTAVNEFKSEIAIQHTLHHPNILQFFGVVLKTEKANSVMIVNEIMFGGTVEGAFKDSVAWSQRTAASKMLDVVRALAYLHNLRPNPIIHRDLKPANLMLTRAGTVKVADFGLSKAFRIAGGSSPQRNTSLKAYKMTGETGSYRYMAPEVFSHLPYNVPVDVYALAMICFQAFTWQQPFTDIPALEAAREAASDTQLRPNAGILPKAWRKTIEEMWDSDPAARPTTMELLPVFESGYEKLEAEHAKDSKSNACCAVM
ncbi:protein kinase [Pseudoscourfieldia marina]